MLSIGRMGFALLEPVLLSFFRAGPCGRRVTARRNGRNAAERTREEAMRAGFTLCAAALAAVLATAMPAAADGSAEARRHPDLHDPGRRAAELRRPPREHLRDGARGGAVLQRADPGQPGQPVLDHRFRLRSVHGDAAADRRRQDLHLQDPRRRQIPRRLAADRRRRGGELEQIIHPPEGVLERRARAIT